MQSVFHCLQHWVENTWQSLHPALQTTGGRIVTSSRTSLEPGKVEALVVINRNKGQLNK